MKNFGKELYFLPLGGSGEIGMNLNLYGYDNQWLIVDFGITFGDDLGIDVIMPDISFLEENRDKIVGMVLTHAHEDHIGAIPYIWNRLRCPMYATPFTAEIIRGKLREVKLQKEAELHVIPVGGHAQLGDFDIEFVTLTHSIPEPSAIHIRTPLGSIVHTGDWKIDADPLVGGTTNMDRLYQIGDAGVLALTCDSTNVFVEEHTQSERAVRESLIELVGQHENRVAIALFASNVARLETCALAAAANNRIPVLVGRSLIRMHEAAIETGYLKDVPAFITPEKAAGLPRDQVLYLCTGSQGEPRAALSRLADRSHPILKFDSGDTVIFSARKIPGNEEAVSQMQNKLNAQGVQIISDGDAFTHVSGHPSRAELCQMYDMVRPRILLPVHGEQVHMYEQAKLARSHGVPEAVVPHNGSVIRLAPGTPQIVSEVTSGRWAFDGARVVSLQSEHIKERSRVMRDGAVFVTFMPDNFNQEPVITYLGLAADEGEEDLLRKLTLREFAGMIDRADDSVWGNDNELHDLIRISVRRATKAVCGRKPHVITHIVRS
ncbi:MAG: ribonuclease J [Alphaproteobacteria bacterium]|nr:ribonuclease J [Alphaproteobacteria bacterium]